MRELHFDGGDDGFEMGEIDVVNAKLAGEFPDAFDGIQIRTVRRQEVQGKPRSLLVAPPQMEFGGMILRVVADVSQLPRNTDPFSYIRGDELFALQRHVFMQIADQIIGGEPPQATTTT